MFVPIGASVSANLWCHGAFPHEYIHWHPTILPPYNAPPKILETTKPKEKKAITDLEGVAADIKAPVPVPAIVLLWKRPTQFSGGYANAIPFLEYNLIETPTIPQLNPTIVSLLAVSMLVYTLSTIAQSAICVNHLNHIIITAVSLPFPDIINAVPFDTSAKETLTASTPQWKCTAIQPSKHIQLHHQQPSYVGGLWVWGTCTRPQHTHTYHQEPTSHQLHQLCRFWPRSHQAGHMGVQTRTALSY